MKFFQKVNMASESIQSFNKTGLYQVSGTNTALDTGSFVLLGALADNDVYNSFLAAAYDMKDRNKFKCLYPGAPTTDINVHVADIVKVSDGSINSNTYRIGAKTLSLTAAAGEPVALRKLELGDQFILGDDNFAAAVSTNGYAILTASDVRLTPAAAIPATGFTVRIEQAVTISEGIDANGAGRLCTVIQL